MGVIEERVARNGRLRYRVKIRIKGRPSMSRTFRRKTDARRWEQQVEGDLRRGKSFPHAYARGRTLADLFEAYEPNLRASSDRRNRVHQLRWWERELGDHHLVDLRAPAIKACWEKLAGSAATRNRYLASLSAALAFAVRELEWIEENPVRRLRREKEPRGRVRFLDEEERQRLLEACRESSDSRLLAITLLAIYTGMRQSEIMRLRWTDIDLSRGRATVHESKNGERRTIPVAGSALETLRRHGAVRRIDSDLVFTNKSGVAAWNRRAWDAAVARAGLSDFRFHDCRHTAASYLLMSGASLPEVAKILGHKTMRMVMRYAHLTEDHTARVVERMTRQFG